MSSYADYKFGNRNDNNSNNNNSNNPEQDELQQIKEKIGHVENESVASTRRALNLLKESEDIGIKTNEELVRQGEVLNKVDKQLDEVNQNLTESQKHLNSVKSVFGSIKNKLFHRKKLPKIPENKQVEVKKQTVEGNPKLKSFNEPRAEFKTITGSEREKEINENLDEMSAGLKRLANLGLDMSSELDRQNNQIDKMNTKAVATDHRIKDQNAQMNKLLK